MAVHASVRPSDGETFWLFLPAYSPELQPAERRWPLLRESIANRTVEYLDQLEARLTHRVKAMMRRPELIAGLTGFHWWTDAVRSVVWSEWA
jgi:hypothetical protein